MPDNNLLQFPTPPPAQRTEVYKKVKVVYTFDKETKGWAYTIEWKITFSGTGVSFAGAKRKAHNKIDALKGDRQ